MLERSRSRLPGHSSILILYMYGIFCFRGRRAVPSTRGKRRLTRKAGRAYTGQDWLEREGTYER